MRGLRSAQLLLEEGAGTLVNLDQPDTQRGFACLLGRRVAHLGQRDLQLLRDQTNGFREGNVLDLLHERQDIARRAAAKAVEELPGGVYRERGRFFLVEGAQPGEVLRATLAQLDVLAHNANDVRLLLDGVRKIARICHVARCGFTVRETR